MQASEASWGWWIEGLTLFPFGKGVPLDQRIGHSEGKESYDMGPIV